MIKKTERVIHEWPPKEIIIYKGIEKSSDKTRGGRYTEEYIKYLKSPEWKRKRREKLEESGGQCYMWKPAKHLIVHGDKRFYQMMEYIVLYEDGGDIHVLKHCDCRGNLQVHHLTYKHLGDEPMEDLVVLCEYHHKQEHV